MKMVVNGNRENTYFIDIRESNRGDEGCRIGAI